MPVMAFLFFDLPPYEMKDNVSPYIPFEFCIFLCPMHRRLFDVMPLQHIP